MRWFWVRFKRFLRGLVAIPPSFEVHVHQKTLKVVKGHLKNRCLLDFKEIVAREGIDNVIIYGEEGSNRPRLVFEGDIAEGHKQRFRNVWFSARR